MVDNHVHKILPSEIILSHMNSVHIQISGFFKIHFNTIFPYTFRSPMLSHHLRCSNQNYILLIFPLVLHIPLSSNTPHFYHPKNSNIVSSLSFRHYLILLLKVPPVPCLTLFSSFPIIWLGFCNHCNLAHII
jgi:hypothetical protein